MSGSKRNLKVVTLAFAVGLASCQPNGTQDDPAIRNTIHAMFDKPGVELVLDPVVASGDYSVVDWTQGNMGGRALLRRINAKWTIVLCAGDQIRSTDALVAAGVPAGDASRIAHALAEAEAHIPRERLSLMSTFGNIVRMDGGTAPH